MLARPSPVLVSLNALSALELEMPIAALELLAFIVGLITFEPFLSNYLLDSSAVLLAHIDAQASPIILSADSAHSPIMQFIHRQLLAETSYNSLEAQLAVTHLFGEGNTLSDAASRGEFERLHRSCQQLRMPCVYMEVPQRARDLVARAAQEFARTAKR